MLITEALLIMIYAKKIKETKDSHRVLKTIKETRGRKKGEIK